MAAIFFASSQTALPNLPAGLSNYTGHFIAYGGLGASAFRAFAHATWAGLTRPSALKGVAFASAYGMTDEVHQIFVPNRFPGADDWVADTLGAIAGVLVVMSIARWRRSHAASGRSV